MTRRYLYRQDIAIKLGVTVWMVTNNEERWGILPYKEQLNDRVIRYKAEPTLKALRHKFPQMDIQ